MKKLRMLIVIVTVLSVGVALSQTRKSPPQEIPMPEPPAPSSGSFDLQDQQPITWRRIDGTELAHIVTFEMGATPGKGDVLDLVAYSPWAENAGHSNIALDTRAGGNAIPASFNLLAYGSAHSSRAMKTLATLSVKNGFIIGDISTLALPGAMLDVKGDVQAQTVQWVPTTSRPTCSAANRGKAWYTAGGSGASDSFEVCRKDVSDSYAWVALF